MEETVYFRVVREAGKANLENLANTEEKLRRKENEEGRRMKNVKEQHQWTAELSNITRNTEVGHREMNRDELSGDLDFEDDMDVKYQLENMSDKDLQRIVQDERNVQQVTESELTPSPLSPEDLLSLPPTKPTPQGSTNLCFRCHEITYHSRPQPLSPTLLPPSPSLSTLLSSIARANSDPRSPPLYVHVLDVVDFPLSFVPFKPTREGEKVLYVVNRADAICERAASMGFLRQYFRREIPKLLQERGIEMEFEKEIEVHPVSAKKGYGIEALLKRIFQLRKAQSNVYFIGTHPHHTARV